MDSSSAPIILHQLLNSDLNLDNYPWAPLREGVDIAKIYEEPATGASAALLRYQAGASVPAHKHLGYEHIFILQGEQQDQTDHYTTGSLLIHPPGTQHSIYSPTGCLALAIWNKPVEFC